MDVELKELEKQLLLACKEGNVEKINQLLQKDINLNCQDKENGDRTPLDYACRFGHIEVVKLLLNDERVDVNKINKGYATPFYMLVKMEKLGL